MWMCVQRCFCFSAASVLPKEVFVNHHTGVKGCSHTGIKSYMLQPQSQIHLLQFLFYELNKKKKMYSEIICFKKTIYQIVFTQ